MHPTVRQLSAIVGDYLSRKDIVMTNKYNPASHPCTRALKDALQLDYGIKVLGRGHYSVVVRTTDAGRDMVVKIGMNVKDVWLGFAVYCQQNPAPCFPMIHSMHLSSKFYLVEMEALEQRQHPGMMRTCYDWETGEEHCITRDKYRVQYMRETFPAFEKMIEVLGTPNDLHRENYMMRGDTVVVTDPYCVTEKCTLKDYQPVAPSEGWKEVKYDDRHREELRDSMSEHSARPQAEVKALRQHPFNDRILLTPRMARLLPQVQGDAPLRAQDIVERRSVGLPQIAKWGREWVQANAIGLQQPLHGKRADLVVMDDLVIAGADFADIEKRVLNHFLVNPIAGNLAPWGRGLAIPEAIQRRPGPDQVQVVPEDPVPEWACVQLEDRAGHLPKQHGKGAVQLRRSNRRGRAECDQGWRVPTLSELLGDVISGRPSRKPVGKTCSCGQPATRYMVRPGQSRAEGCCKPCAYRLAYGIRIPDRTVA